MIPTGYNSLESYIQDLGHIFHGGCFKTSFSVCVMAKMKETRSAERRLRSSTAAAEQADFFTVFSSSFFSDRQSDGRTAMYIGKGR